MGRGAKGIPASPMTKFFNNNYHVIMPEIEFAPYYVETSQIPSLNKDDTVLALPGPATLLKFSKYDKKDYSENDLFKILSQQYLELFKRIPKNKIIQLEEPAFVTDGIPKNYETFLKSAKNNIILQTYFESAPKEILDLPVYGIGLDFVEGKDNFKLLKDFPNVKLVGGIIHGRNKYSQLDKAKESLETILQHVPEKNVIISPSCPLMLTYLGEGIRKLKELDEIRNEVIS